MAKQQTANQNIRKSISFWIVYVENWFNSRINKRENFELPTDIWSQSTRKYETRRAIKPENNKYVFVFDNKI